MKRIVIVLMMVAFSAALMGCDGGSGSTGPDDGGDVMIVRFVGNVQHVFPPIQDGKIRGVQVNGKKVDVEIARIMNVGFLPKRGVPCFAPFANPAVLEGALSEDTGVWTFGLDDGKTAIFPADRVRVEGKQFEVVDGWLIHYFN